MAAKLRSSILCRPQAFKLMWHSAKKTEWRMEKTELDCDESIISLDVKRLYTNVPLKEAAEIALRRLYQQVNPPETSRKTMKNY